MSLFDSASIVVTPNAYKASKLYAIKPTDGSGDLTVVRATSATRVNSEGLIEIPRTNLLERSEEFGDASWVKVNTSVTSNSGVSPNGTTTADKIIPSATSSFKEIYNDSTLTSGIVYTQTYYVKADGYRYIQILSPSVNIGTMYANFDLQTATKTDGTSGYGSIQSVGNGWCRITATFTQLVTGIGRVSISIIPSSNSARASTWTANGTDGVLVWGAQLQVGNVATEYIPTTSSIRTKFAGIIQDGSSAPNIPRLDYTNSTCPSILVEPQITNVTLRSEEFDNDYWVKINSDITSNTTIAPDGNLTADTFSDRVLTNQSYTIRRNQSYTSGTTYTSSFFAKNLNRRYVYMRFVSSVFGTNKYAFFDLQLGTVISADSGVIAEIINYGNGWFRCIATSTASVTTSTASGILIGLSDNGVNVEYINPSVKSIYIWGAQLEAASNATSYIHTTTASVTRNADVISKTGISSLIGQTEGTIFVNFNKTKINLSILSIDNGTANNRIFLEGAGTSTGLRVRITNGGTTTVDNTSNVLQNGINKIALVYANNNVYLYRNGVLIFNDNSATIPNTSILRIGSNVSNLFQLDDSINSAALWKTALTDQECINLTTI